VRDSVSEPESAAVSVPFHLAGVSHHTAEVSVRERLSPAPEDALAWLARARDAGTSLVVLSTCNRFELYGWGDGDPEGELRRWAASRGVALDDGLLYRRDGTAALRHLFWVAAGLDSQIVGETEILGQVRRAVELARRAGTTTWELEAAFAAAVSSGRRVRRETRLGRHPESVSSAAVAQARRCLGDSLQGRGILVLGAGEAADGVLRALDQEAPGAVVVLNRHPERARELTAGRAGAGAAGWDEVPRALAEADVVFAATAAPGPVLDAATVAGAMEARGGRPLFVFDLALPRNVDPAARDLPGVRLFDLDDLRLQHCPAAVADSPVLAEAERIVRAELARFRRRLRHRAAGPRLARLHRLAARLAEEEANRALEQLESLTESQREVVRRMADRLVRRVLYPASKVLGG